MRDDVRNDEPSACLVILVLYHVAFIFLSERSGPRLSGTRCRFSFTGFKSRFDDESGSSAKTFAYLSLVLPILHTLSISCVPV